MVPLWFKNYDLHFSVFRQEITSYDEMCSKRRLDGLAWLQLKCTMIQGFGIMTTMYGEFYRLESGFSCEEYKLSAIVVCALSEILCLNKI